MKPYGARSGGNSAAKRLRKREALDESARLVRKMELERSALIADAWAAQRPRSVCTCGHSGDGENSQHKPGFKGFAPGHGACKVPGCVCVKFSWASWLQPEPK